MDPTMIFSFLMGGIGLLVPICTSGIVLVIVGIIAYAFVKRAQKSSAANAAARAWPSVNGVILVSTTRWEQGPNHTNREVPVVVYQYVVGGQSYQGQTIRPGDAFLQLVISGQAAQTAARYPVGASVPVYYNPSSPGESALEILP